MEYTWLSKIEVKSIFESSTVISFPLGVNMFREHDFGLCGVVSIHGLIIPMLVRHSFHVVVIVKLERWINIRSSLSLS